MLSLGNAAANERKTMNEQNIKLHQKFNAAMT